MPRRAAIGSARRSSVYLYYIGIAFSIWMIVDAVRRRAEFYWFLIIIFLPFGSLLYFALVKLKDYDLGRLTRRLPAGGAGKDIAKLESAVTETPSVANKLALADALEERKRYTEATPLYREVLARDDEDKQALHGLARCLLDSGEPVEAAEHYEKLLLQDRAYRDYSAALEYAEALWQSGRADDTIDLMTGLVGVSPYINHRLALAHYLSLHGRPERAREVLHEALEDYDKSPQFVKRRDRDFARRAKKMLASVGAGAK